MIGENVRRLRIDRQLTQEQLAERAGVKQSQVSAWETGKTGLDVGNVIKLAVGLGVNVDAVVRGLEPAYDQRISNIDSSRSQLLHNPASSARLSPSGAATNQPDTARWDSSVEHRSLPPGNHDPLITTLEQTARSLAGSVAGLDATARLLAGALGAATAAQLGRSDSANRHAVPDQPDRGRKPRRRAV